MNFRIAYIFTSRMRFFTVVSILQKKNILKPSWNTAAHFGYSVSHFSTLIKEGTGRTFLQIIRDIKLNQACRALRKTTLSIPAICELVGYETPEHFMRTFKKAYALGIRLADCFSKLNACSLSFVIRVFVTDDAIGSKRNAIVLAFFFPAAHPLAVSPSVGTKKCYFFTCKL